MRHIVTPIRTFLMSLAIGSIAVASVMAHRPCQTPSSMTVEERRLAERILAGDLDAIGEAARSGNRSFVPYLRRELNDPRNKNTSLSPIEFARIALAKLGEADQMQEMWCRAISEDPDFGVGPPVRDLGSVGGWFGIQALQKFLRPEGQIHWGRAYAKHKGDADISFPRPQYLALQALSETIANPPVAFTPSALSPQEGDRQAKIWDTWISAHKDELSRLKPTGEGVDLSDKACKNGKPVKR